MKQIVTKKCKSFSLTDEMKPPGQLPLSLTNGFEWANQHLDPVWQNLKKTKTLQWRIMKLWILFFWWFLFLPAMLFRIRIRGHCWKAKKQIFPSNVKASSFQKNVKFFNLFHHLPLARETKYFFEFSGFSWRIRYQQLTHLGRMDSTVAKSKFTMVQIFPAVWAGRRSLCM